jgi:hypothetical protein
MFFAVKKNIFLQNNIYGKTRYCRGFTIGHLRSALMDKQSYLLPPPKPDPVICLLKFHLLMAFQIFPESPTHVLYQNNKEKMQVTSGKPTAA